MSVDRSLIAGLVIDVSRLAGGFAAAGLAGPATALIGCLLSCRSSDRRSPADHGSPYRGTQWPVPW